MKPTLTRGASGKFELGQMVMTRNFIAMFGDPDDLNTQIQATLAARDVVNRHVSGDWGDLDAFDKSENDKALKSGERILSQYTVNGEQIYVITEHDRSVTTVLLSSDY